MRIQLLAASLCLTALSSVTIADTPSRGFQFSSQVAPAVPFAAYVTLSDGNRVYFDGEFVDVYDPSGALVAGLGDTGAGFAFSSFIVVDPTETFVIVGESSNHGLFKVDLGGGGFTPLGTMAFNFAAVFETSNTVVISAATCGFSCGNDLVRLNTDSGVQTVLGHVPGPSGPVAFAPNGDLFYGTQSPFFPTPVGSLSIVNWTPTQVALGSLDENNWTVFAEGLDGASSIAIDPANDHVFVAESTFGAPANSILEFTDQGAALPDVVRTMGTLISNLEFLNTNGSGEFRRFREFSGSGLSYHSTDFAAIDDLILVEPMRVNLDVVGVGTNGVGQFHVVITGAPAGAKIALWRDAQFLLQPADRAVDFGFTYPVVSDFSIRALDGALGMPNTYNFDGLILTANKQGVARMPFFNTGRIDGVFAYQAFVMTPALDLVGTSNTVLR